MLLRYRQQTENDLADFLEKHATGSEDPGAFATELARLDTVLHRLDPNRRSAILSPGCFEYAWVLAQAKTALGCLYDTQSCLRFRYLRIPVSAINNEADSVALATAQTAVDCVWDESLHTDQYAIGHNDFPIRGEELLRPRDLSQNDCIRISRKHRSYLPLIKYTFDEIASESISRVPDRTEQLTAETLARVIEQSALITGWYLHKTLRQ